MLPLVMRVPTLPSMTFRLTATACLAVTLGAFARGPSGITTTRPSGFGAAADCARCHAEIAAEWQGSAHARAFTDPVWKKAAAATTDPQRCTGCHAPEPVQRRLGRPPEARADERVHGVSCVACHEHRGSIQGPFGTMVDGHAADANPLFASSSSVHLCASCHDTRIGPVLPLARDFRNSSHARAGKSCVNCHMPRLERTIATDPATGKPSGPVREGRSHELLGPTDVDFAASAFAVEARRVGERVRVAISNLAGHRVPGLVGRSFEFEVEQFAGERSLGSDTIRLTAENLLLVDEERRFRLQLRVGSTAAVVRVRHVLSGTATELEERRFEW